MTVTLHDRTTHLFRVQCTHQKKKRTLSYFHGEKFADIDSSRQTAYFTSTKTLSNLEKQGLMLVKFTQQETQKICFDDKFKCEEKSSMKIKGFISQLFV